MSTKDMLNRIYNEDCLETMARMESGSVDLTVTSPPYDNLRTYNGYKFEFEKIAQELFRVTKYGGVLVWVVNDATINGSETGTSFRQALHFMSVGFNLHDTMIYEKANFSNPSNNRYHQIFEYVFILSNGKPKTFNPILDVKNKYGVCWGKNTSRQKDGTMKEQKKNLPREFGMRTNIWRMNTAGQENVCMPIEHPATFPEQLAKDHVFTWSNEREVVYDCFMGSGTTAKAAILLERNFIGSEVSKEYCTIANKRIEPQLAQGALALSN